MEKAVTNKVQWGILALSALLLLGAVHAQAQIAPDAEMPPDAAPHRIRIGVAPVIAQLTPQTSPQKPGFGDPLRGAS